jgi:ATP/maltotriose-dependent transcriptional regulator MalT
MSSACAGAWIRGDLTTAGQVAQAALTEASYHTPTLSRRAVEQVGEVALLNGDTQRAVKMYDRAHQLSLEADDTLQATWDLGSSALALCYSGQPEGAGERANSTLALARRVDNPSANAFAHFVLGEVAAVQDPPRAKALLEHAIALAASVENDFIAGLARVTLAGLAPHDGASLASTTDQYRAAIICWDQCDAWNPLWVALRNVVGLLTTHSSFRDAALLYGAVLRAAGTASPLYGTDLIALEQVRATLDRELGVDRTGQLLADGEHLSRHAVVAHALRSLDDLGPGIIRQSASD